MKRVATVERVAIAVALAVVAGVVLSGCSDPHPVPLDTARKVALYERVKASDWRILQSDRAAGATPDLRVVTVSNGPHWALNMAGCLENRGVASFQVTDDGTITLSRLDQDNGFGILSTFICRARYPRSQDLALFLSSSQASVLYDYYVDSLQPCLLMNGHNITTPPTRRVFVSQFAGGTPWSPYLVIENRHSLSNNLADQSGLAALKQVCPPYPRWIDLSS